MLQLFGVLVVLLLDGKQRIVTVSIISHEEKMVSE